VGTSRKSGRNFERKPSQVFTHSYAVGPGESKEKKSSRESAGSAGGRIVFRKKKGRKKGGHRRSAPIKSAFLQGKAGKETVSGGGGTANLGPESLSE